MKSPFEVVSFSNIAIIQEELNNKLDKDAKAADSDELDGLDSTSFARTDDDTDLAGDVIKMSNLPTSDPGVENQLWNNDGVLSISAG